MGGHRLCSCLAISQSREKQLCDVPWHAACATGIHIFRSSNKCFSATFDRSYTFVPTQRTRLISAALQPRRRVHSVSVPKGKRIGGRSIEVKPAVRIEYVSNDICGRGERCTSGSHLAVTKPDLRPFFVTNGKASDVTLSRPQTSISKIYSRYPTVRGGTESLTILSTFIQKTAIVCSF